jgi:CHAT domain-containing protein
MQKYNSILFVFTLLLLSCKKESKPELKPFNNDSSHLKRIVLDFKSTQSIDDFLNFGLFNLAYCALVQNESYFNDSIKMSYAFQFAEYGEFDKANAIIPLVKSQVFRFEKDNFQLFCELKKQDTIRAQELFKNIDNQYRSALNQREKLELLLQEAYLEHNKKNYKRSIYLNECALEKIKSLTSNAVLLAKVYRRLGNNYNDIVRDKIKFNLPKNLCYEKGLAYYANELRILNLATEKNKNKLALNKLTTLMLTRMNLPDSIITKEYQKILDLLIVYKNSDFIVSRNPIYTSIALTQLGTEYYESGKKDNLDQNYALSNLLLNNRALNRINSKESLDAYEYFAQIISDRKIQFALKHEKNKSKLKQKILNISSQNKYRNQELNQQINYEFGQMKSELALHNWLLWNELHVLGKLTKNSKLSSLTTSKIRKYKPYITRLFRKREISKSNVAKLIKWCGQNNSSIVDLQVLPDSTILNVTITKHGVDLYRIKDVNKLLAKKIQELQVASTKDDIGLYATLAFSIFKQLKLNQIKTKNIIVCPDEYLEKIPFDGLIYTNSKAKIWSKLKYFGSQHTIRLTPNIGSISLQKQQPSPLHIDIWTNQTANKTLPYNKHLIDHLKETYSTRFNQKNPNHILHIVGHTFKTNKGELGFKFPWRTISNESNIQFNPKLAILEGCSTGFGKNLKIAGTLSLTRTFLFSGTKTVIYSLWDADNQSSTKLFELFYGYLDKGYSASNSLRNSKTALIQDYTHPEWANPFYWANYQLTGADLHFIQ